jgi:hypothetical protein
MNGNATRRLGRARKAVLAMAALGAVLLPASAAEAAASFGHFEGLGTQEIGGFAVLNRSAVGTHGVIVVRGLEPGVTYAAHLHSAVCSATNPGGGHYKDDTTGAGAPPNELWFSSTGDPFDGITANRAGIAIGRGSADWVARADARAVVIHAIPPNGTTAGGPKIACADLG